MTDEGRLRHYNHHEHQSVADAYRLYDVMLKRCPTIHSDQLGGFYMLNSYAEVKRAAKAWELFSSAESVFLPRLEVRFPPIDTDPPEATWWRNLVRDELSVAGVAQFEEAVRQDVETLCAGFLKKGDCDLVAELCEPLPVMGICHVLGVDRDRVPTVRRIALELFESMSDPALFKSAYDMFSAFALSEMEARRGNPRDDLLTRLATHEFDGKRAPDDQLLILLVGLLTAGHHTTTSAMSSVFLHIAADPSVRDRLVADPRAIRTATEEAIRLRTPQHLFFRQTTRETVVGDLTIPAGCPVALNYAAANVDPEAFDRPKDFRLDRTPNPHMGFGHGPHTCVGAPLSRMEIRLAVEHVLERAPDIRLAAPLEDLSYRFVGGVLAVLDDLPVAFKRVSV